jgi:phenylpropionate dioxygenase-like ring-hydroxylating dioxygenase large terminal subunit
MPVTPETMLEQRMAYSRRIAAHIRNGTSDLADAPMVNDVSVYIDPVRHAAERQKLFRETPQLVCLSTQLSEPGQFRTFDETGVPVVVTRTASGEVKAFLNICPHRGARLVRQGEGKANRFTCWFHGWTYANDGRQIAAPEAERFCGGMEGREHLIDVPCAEKYGMIFVVATPGAPMDIDAHLGSFAAVLDGLNLHTAEAVKTGILPVASNWKYALDTYGEGYHFAALHKKTLAPYFRNDITIYDRYDRHHRVGFVQKDWNAWADRPESEWGVRAEASGIHYLFPNVILFAGSTSPGKTYLTIFRHHPGETSGETKTYKTIYAFGGVKTDEYRAEVEAAFDATAHVVTTEDYVTAAEGWKNLCALPKGSTVVYGRQEIALQFQHRAIADACGMPLPHASTPIREAAE